MAIPDRPATLSALAVGHLPTELVVAGAVIMAMATLLGASLALLTERRHEAWLGAAAGALLVIAFLHLLPDAWSAAHRAGLWPLAVPAAAAISFALAGWTVRRGCWCGTGRRRVAGAGTAGALAVHRFLEGSALALAVSVTVTLTLAVHALAEGLAAGTLLAGQSRRSVAGWLAAMCLSPALGVVAVRAIPLSSAAEPVLLALAAGVLAQVARISLNAAWHVLGRWRLAPATAVSFLAAATVTALTVRVTG